jgi:hypothetical protein
MNCDISIEVNPRSTCARNSRRGLQEGRIPVETLGIFEKKPMSKGAQGFEKLPGVKVEFRNGWEVEKSTSEKVLPAVQNI